MIARVLSYPGIIIAWDLQTQETMPTGGGASCAPSPPMRGRTGIIDSFMTDHMRKTRA